MAHRDLLGRIDCPHCGCVEGMKVTEDRAGKPFGNCDVQCHGQLRIGDKSNYRVSLFYKKYPHVQRVGDPVTVTGANVPVTVTGAKNPVTVTGAKNPVTVTGAKNPVTVTEKNKEVVPGSPGPKTEANGVQLPVTDKPVVKKSALLNGLYL